MDLKELEVIDKLHLNEASEFDGVIPADVLAAYCAKDPFAEATPVLSVVQLVSTNDVDSLSAVGIEHYDLLKTSGILPAVFRALEESTLLSALEFLAFAKYEKQASLELPQKDIDFTEWSFHKEDNKDATPAGYAAKPKHTPVSLTESQKGYFSARPWLLQFFIENRTTDRSFVNLWWPLVIPALLNFLDTGDFATKHRAVQLVDSLVTHHASRLKASGLTPVFESSVEPCLSFLPPMVEVSRTKLMHRPALLCLLKLAQTYDDKIRYNARMHFLTREGCFKPFLHAEEKVDLYLYFIETLLLFLRDLKSLAVAHLHALVQLCNNLLTDPFIDCSPDLLAAVCEVLETTISYCWPRIEQYRYTIMLGLARANALDTRACALLNPTSEEIERITTTLTIQ